MPRTNINYSNTIIYKLCCKDLSITEVYVGQTTDMRRRKNNHKKHCNNEKHKYYNYKVYQYIRENGGFDNWDMIEIERYEAIDGNDARKRERYWIEELKATLNMVIPSRSHNEYYQDNKEYYKEYNKQYRIEYYNNNRESIIEKNKKYRDDNKEEYIKRYNTYNKNNKDIINEKAKEKVKCECGCEIRKGGLKEHMKTKKHIDLMS